MHPYATVIVDLMNHIRGRGTDERRGNSLFAVTLLKLKHITRSWFVGSRSQGMKQLHVHIDDPVTVIPQKRGEQTLWNTTREVGSNRITIEEEDLRSIGFHFPNTVPWGTQIASRGIRDTVFSLHLFCAGLAAITLVNENYIEVDIYMYGGCFCLKGSCIGLKPNELVPEVCMRKDECEGTRSGEVVLQ